MRCSRGGTSGRSVGGVIIWGDGLVVWKGFLWVFYRNLMEYFDGFLWDG